MPPKTEKDKKACLSQLNKLHKRFHGNKNEMAKQLGVSRQTVGWWFTKGYIGSTSAKKIAGHFGEPLANFRPDLDRENKPAAASST